MAEGIKCSNCEHCREFRPVGNTRSEFTCEHPDYDHIRDYFRKHNIHKMERFLGFGARFSKEVPIKTSPAWCPKKKSKEDK